MSLIGKIFLQLQTSRSAFEAPARSVSIDHNLGSGGTVKRVAGGGLANSGGGSHIVINIPAAAAAATTATLPRASEDESSKAAGHDHANCRCNSVRNIPIT